MMFRQSIEEHFRNDLFNFVKPYPEFENVKPLDADKYVAMSVLQKAVRRGAFDFAYAAALALLNDDVRSFWKRMCVIAFEDIGIANIDLVGRVTIAAGDKRFRQKLGGDRIVAATLITEMCKSEKDRSTDDLLEFVEYAKTLDHVRDDLTEMNLQQRIAKALDDEQPFSIQATAIWAAAVGLPFEPQKRQDRIACPSAYFEALTESGYDRTCIELSKLGLSRSGVPLPVFLPPLYSKMKNEPVGITDDAFPPETLIEGIPSWAFNGHTRTGLSAFREYINRSKRMREFIAASSTRDLSKAKIVAALIFRLESGQMAKRVNWPTGNKIRQSNERLGWGIPDEAVLEGNGIAWDEFDLINECRMHAYRLYIR